MKKIIMLSVFAALAFTANAQEIQNNRLSLKVKYRWNPAIKGCVYTGNLTDVCPTLINNTNKTAKPAADELLVPYTIDRKNQTLTAEFDAENVGKDAQAILTERSFKIVDAILLKNPSPTIPNNRNANTNLSFTLKPGEYKIEAVPTSGTGRGKLLKQKIVIHIEIGNQ